MASYNFPGYPAFLDAAAAELGHPEAAGPARRISTLTALANLCAQAAHGDREHVEGILVKAAEFRDQLATALRAAELMLADVEAGRRPSSRPEVEIETKAESPSAPSSPPVPRAGRKGPGSLREPS